MRTDVADPPLPVAVGALASLGVATAYVASLYALVPARVRALPRNDARHVRARAAAVVLSTGAALGAVRALVGPDAWRLTGVAAPTARWWDAVVGVGAPLAAVATLLAGPLVQAAAGRTPLEFAGLDSEEDRWVTARNLVVAPVSEELVFRGAVVALLASSGASRAALVWGSPLFFGVAHVHHLYGSLRAGVPLAPALARTAFQAAYTTLFGSLEVELMLRARSVWGAAAVHALCNLVGFPRFDLLLHTRARDPASVLVLAAYVAGAAAFVAGDALGWVARVCGGG